MKPHPRIDGCRAKCSAWLIVLPALASVLLTWPAWAAPEAPDVEESTPDTAVHLDPQQLETIVRDRYPELVTHRFAGVPVVTVLLNHDGTLAATDLEISLKDPDELVVTRLHFARFGVQAKDLSYIGTAHLELALNTVLVMFGGKRTDPAR